MGFIECEFVGGAMVYLLLFKVDLATSTRRGIRAISVHCRARGSVPLFCRGVGRGLACPVT